MIRLLSLVICLLRELFTNDIDSINLRLIDINADVLQPGQKAVDIDDVVLLAIKLLILMILF